MRSTPWHTALIVAVISIAGCQNRGLQSSGIASAAGTVALNPSSSAGAGSGAPAGSGVAASAAASGGVAGMGNTGGLDSLGRAGTAGAGIAGAGIAGAGGMAGSAAAGGSLAAGSGTGGMAAQAPSACTGKPGKLRGKSSQMIAVGSAQRSFLYYAPNSLDANTPAPLVFVPHGFTLTADSMVEITGYTDLADKEKFVVIFPNGDGTTWNFGGSDCSSTILGILPESTSDDQGFVDGMIKFADADQCIDHPHIFMTGFSMGAYFTNENGCLRSDIRAIAPHSGGSHDLSSCPSKHKPVLVMHFDPDDLIPYMCGQSARDRWVKQNGCQLDSPDVKMVNGGSCEYYKGCPADGQVAFCTFMSPAGMRSEAFPGHAWSGGSKQGTSGGAAFAIPETESATQLGWNFFKQYAW
jgi:poly(3-hydroxybutyrate) depolymerase